MVKNPSSSRQDQGDIIGETAEAHRVRRPSSAAAFVLIWAAGERMRFAATMTGAVFIVGISGVCAWFGDMPTLCWRADNDRQYRPYSAVGRTDNGASFPWLELLDMDGIWGPAWRRHGWNMKVLGQKSCTAGYLIILISPWICGSATCLMCSKPDSVMEEFVSVQFQWCCRWECMLKF